MFVVSGFGSCTGGKSSLPFSLWMWALLSSCAILGVLEDFGSVVSGCRLLL
jgi:hypothetical protein